MHAEHKDPFHIAHAGEEAEEKVLNADSWHWFADDIAISVQQRILKQGRVWRLQYLGRNHTWVVIVHIMCDGLPFQAKLSLLLSPIFRTQT